MTRYEYKVIPAPTKGEKAKGIKTAEGRFANALEVLMNRMAGDGWEFQRAELLPSEERTGLTGSTTNWRNVLVFRRPAADDLSAFSPREPAIAAPVPEAQPQLQAYPVDHDTGEDVAEGEPPAEPAEMDGTRRAD